MEYIGEHIGRKVFWWHYSAETLEELPEKNWICFAIEDGLQEGERKGLSKDFITKYFDAVHMESINHQKKVLDS